VRRNAARIAFAVTPPVLTLTLSFANDCEDESPDMTAINACCVPATIVPAVLFVPELCKYETAAAAEGAGVLNGGGSNASVSVCLPDEPHAVARPKRKIAATLKRTLMHSISYRVRRVRYLLLRKENGTL
jgi:hypothetical protein